jgi:hypothetical protein
VEGVAGAIFPVLFIGLASLAATRRSHVVRGGRRRAHRRGRGVAARAPDAGAGDRGSAGGPAGARAVSALALLTIALITYASRAAAVVLLPRPSARFEIVLSRIPVAIFASLATATLLGEGGALPAPPVLGAAIGALLASPARSLLPVLIGGAIGYAAGLFV